MAKDPNLKDVYAISSQDGLNALYREWAHSYDTGFSEAQGYQLPRAVAQAFLGAGGTGPVLDVGGGTGLVAEHLTSLGVTTIDALDLSDDMLGVARMKGIYRDLIRADIKQKLPSTTPSYRGIVSAGTFTLGHVGPEGIGNLLGVADTGAVIVISVNAAHFESAGFAAELDTQKSEIVSLKMQDVRIFDDRADDAHRNDIARLLIFGKA